MRATGSCLVLWGLLLGSSSAAAQDARALSLLEGASARYGAATTMCADFVQHLEVTLLGDDRTGIGRMCQAQPDRFAMRFSEPAGDLVVIDGTWVWVYYPSLDPKQVLRSPLEQSTRGFDFHREFLERPAEKYVASYDGAETLAGHDTHRIRLVPRERTSYDVAVLWIDASDRLLRKIRVEEENGTVRTVTLENVELDSAVPDDWFVFTPPPGAQVISR